MGNLALQHWFDSLMSLIMAKLPDNCITVSKTVKDLTEDCILVVFLRSLKQDAKAGKLCRQITKWFGELKPKDKCSSLGLRFTGEETKKVCHHFPEIMNSIKGFMNNDDERLSFQVLLYRIIQLCKCVSLFSRVDISEEQNTVNCTLMCMLCSAQNPTSLYGPLGMQLYILPIGFSPNMGKVWV